MSINNVNDLVEAVGEMSGNLAVGNLFIVDDVERLEEAIDKDAFYSGIAGEFNWELPEETCSMAAFTTMVTMKKGSVPGMTTLREVVINFGNNLIVTGFCHVIRKEYYAEGCENTINIIDGINAVAIFKTTIVDKDNNIVGYSIFYVSNVIDCGYDITDNFRDKDNQRAFDIGDKSNDAIYAFFVYISQVIRDN